MIAPALSRYSGAAAALGVLVALVVSIDLGESTTEPAPSQRSVNDETRPASVSTDDTQRDRTTLRATSDDSAARLRWADGIPLAEVPAELERIENLDSPEARAAMRRALLFSWTGRDLVAVMRWVGGLSTDHRLRQEGLAQIVEALRECRPEDVVEALREAPETTARQLYGPYFRSWATDKPAGAATMLIRLGETTPREAGHWNDLLGQVSAVWMAVEPRAAIEWINALPEGAAKTAALLQAGHRWTELDPRAAAAAASRNGEPRLVRTVAAKWAEAEPADALAWAQGLPEGTLRTEAVDVVRAIRAQAVD